MLHLLLRLSQTAKNNFVLRSVWPGSHRALAERNPAFADLIASFDPPPAGGGRFKAELLEDYEAVLGAVKKQTPFVFSGAEGDCMFFVRLVLLQLVG